MSIFQVFIVIHNSYFQNFIDNYLLFISQFLILKFHFSDKTSTFNCFKYSSMAAIPFQFLSLNLFKACKSLLCRQKQEDIPHSSSVFPAKQKSVLKIQLDIFKF